MGKILTKEIIISKAKKVHGALYDYSKVEYISIHKQITIVCNVHGEFQQRAYDHIYKKSKCPKCAGKHYHNTNSFIEKAKTVHGNLYDYSESNYVNYFQKLKIICSKHGVFLQTPQIHLQGRSGCQKCRLSRGSFLVQSILEELEILFEKEKTFNECRNPNTNRLLKFDFYLPDKNLLIEYDGEQHFKLTKRYNSKEEFDKIQFRDNIKDIFCKEKKINLLRIPYWEKDVKGLLAEVWRVEI